MSLLTGSYAYGTPTEDSDIDLVVMLSETEAEYLVDCSDDSRGSGTGLSLRFGRLNLIICVDQYQFDLWKQGTEILKAKAPVTREYAVKHFSNLLNTPELD